MADDVDGEEEALMLWLDEGNYESHKKYGMKETKNTQVEYLGFDYSTDSGCWQKYLGIMP